MVQKLCKARSNHATFTPRFIAVLFNEQSQLQVRMLQ